MTERATTDVREHAGAASGDQPRFSYAVATLERSIRRSLGAVLRPYGLTVAEYTALSLIRRREGYSNAQLARRSFVSPQAMNEVVKSLEERDLLRRELSTSHKAIRHTHLTREGRALLGDCDGAVDRMEAVMLAGLAQQERSEAIALLLRCADELRASLPADR
jgi:DNA-binding MarR family transcriptional regulator